MGGLAGRMPQASRLKTWEPPSGICHSERSGTPGIAVKIFTLEVPEGQGGPEHGAKAVFHELATDRESPS